MSDSTFLLPDLGEGLESATVIGWHVAVGDEVSVDQPVVEVETAKAAVEVPVPFAGVVAQLHAAPGESIKVGTPLISVAPSARDYAGFSEPGVVTANAAGDDTCSTGSGNVLIGYGTSDDAQRRTRSRRRGRAEATARADGPTPVISPLVRKYAHDHGVDVNALRGSGPHGLVHRADVEKALTQQRIPAADATDSAEVATATDSSRIPLTGVRRAMADTLSRSRREIPEATVWVDVDATDLLAAREALNARSPHAPVSLLGMLGRFVVLALRRYPELNARVEADAVVLNERVNLGFAAQTDRGLLVPVVHDAQAMNLRDLSAALTERTRAAREGSLTPAALTGGTITVNNYGVFGVDGSAAIINHPEVAIVGMGRIIDRPWVVDGTLTVRKVSELTLAFDHRACDGGTAGGFLRYLADCVESPITALADA